ncbi:MAG TPA: TonB-dependent receptor [Pyrinomonadaceae bacterium]|jgi:hypothetical protein
MTRRHTCLLFVFLLTAHCSLLTVFGQSATATLTGTVVDQNGAAVPGTAITILNADTSLQREATTNDDGNFTVPLLSPGAYTVSARRDGFAPLEIPNVVLNVGDQKGLRIQLKAGDVNATVQVQSEVPLINESPAVGTVIDRQFVGNLPLNGRSFQSLILLTPGIVQTTSDFNHPGEFSVNGQRQNANYFTVDGVSANTGVGANSGAGDLTTLGGSLPGNTALGTTNSLVSLDALEEFRIETSSYSAQYGRQPGAQVQLVTRSGSNQFHGSAFEYIRNEAFDATDWFANANSLPKPQLRQNQFGGTFSGPIMLPSFGEGDKPYWSGRNKTFFFLSYEGHRLRVPVLTTNPLVPSLRIRQAAAPVLQPILNAYPIPTGPEIVVSGSPSGAAPFASSYSNPSAADTTSIRIDQVIGTKGTVFGRYSFTPSSSLSRTLNQLVGNVLGNSATTLGATFSLTPRMSNELRFNYTVAQAQSTFAMDSFGGAVPIDTSQLLTGYNGSLTPLRGFINFRLPSPGFKNLFLGDTAHNYSRQINVVDNISLLKGPHLLKFGMDWRRLSSILAPVGYGQNITFRTQAEVVSGIARSVLVFSTKGVRPVYDNLSAFLQDRWQVSKRLTLDLGVRWELNPVPHDSNGFKPVLLSGITGSDVSKAALAPPGTSIYKTTYTAFAPRVGMAYQLRSASGRETVLRAGFGMFYDLGSGLGASVFNSSAFGITSFTSFSNVQLPLTAAQAAPPPFPTTLTLPAPFNFFPAVNPDLKLPYTLQWNVALEQALGANQSISLSYVASAARRLLTTASLNQPTPDPFSSPRPNPNFGSIAFASNGPTSNYQALQAQYQRRLSRGLQALVNYTWSHAIDEVSNEVDAGTFDRGDADFDIRHNFTAALTYNVPRLTGSSRFVRTLTNGWSVNSTFYARSGQPLEIFAGQMFLADGRFVNVRADRIAGQQLWIKDSSVAGGQRLNPAAFGLPPQLPGQTNVFLRQGTLGRNVVRVPGIYQVNIGVLRQIPLTERLNLQFRAEMFNALNHPLFGGYESNIQQGSLLGVPFQMLSTGFSGNGQGGLNSLYQIGGPRSMQFSIRLGF